MKINSKFFLFLPSLILILILPYDVFGIESEKNQNTFSTFVNRDIVGFSLEYPFHFEIKESILDSQGWMFSLNDTKDQTITLDVFALPLDPELIPVQDKAIIDYMFLLNFYDCDQATLNQTGYECFNFSPLDYDINHQNDIEYFEIEYSILTKNTLGNYTDRTKIVTDIWLPSENHLLSIHGTFDPEEYLESKNIYDEIVKSINFEVPSIDNPELPIELKIKGALWTQDLISDLESKVPL